MQHQLMHHHHTAAAFNNSSSTITTDHIQQYLDENKALILNILENQNTGKFSECAENQSRLQHNLMYLAAIADCQPKPSFLHLQQYMNSMPQQQLHSQQTVPQSQIAFTQHPPFTVMQQQHALQSQLGIGSTGIHTPRTGTSLEGEGSGTFPDFSQSILGEGSQGISTKAPSCSTAKENRSIISSAEDGDNPQKKGKLS